MNYNFILDPKKYYKIFKLSIFLILIQTKTTIVNELDHTLSTCETDNAIQYQLCIAKDLPSATVLVGGYYASTLALKESARIFNYTVSIRMLVCLLKPEATFNLALLSGKVSADECIDNA